MTGAVTVRFLRKSTRNSLIAFILIASLHSKHFFSNESSEVHWSPTSKPVNLPWNYFLTHLVLNCRPRWWENISIIVRALPHRRLGESRSRSAPGEIEKLCPEGGRGGGSPSLSHMVCTSPKGVVFGPFLVWKRVYTLPILVWNRPVWFSRELRECMNVFIVSIRNEQDIVSICEFEMHLKNQFWLRFNLRNDDINSV